MENKPIKYREICPGCGAPEMYYLKTSREAYGTEFVKVLYCEICEAQKEVSMLTNAAEPILQRTVSTDEAVEALKKVFQASQVLAEHAESTGTAFLGVLTVDYGKGHKGAADFVIGAPGDMLDALVRLLTQRSELVDTLLHAVSIVRYNQSVASIEAVRAAYEKQVKEGTVNARFQPDYIPAVDVERVDLSWIHTKQGATVLRSDYVELVGGAWGRTHINTTGVTVHLNNISFDDWRQVIILDEQDIAPIQMEKLKEAFSNSETKMRGRYKVNCGACETREAMPEDVFRIQINKWSKKGKTMLIREVYNEYGYRAMSEIKPEHREEIINKIQNLLNK
jgi:hypothetical protein